MSGDFHQVPRILTSMPRFHIKMAWIVLVTDRPSLPGRTPISSMARTHLLVQIIQMG